jgi:hypothetical protein
MRSKLFNTRLTALSSPTMAREIWTVQYQPLRLYRESQNVSVREFLSWSTEAFVEALMWSKVSLVALLRY